jgi:hypothetical protein
VGHDLIRAIGPVPGCTEIDVCDTGEGFVRLSTGEVFRAKYDPADGWRIERHRKELGPCGCSILPAVPRGDRLLVTGPVEWVELWPNYPATVTTSTFVLDTTRSTTGDGLVDAGEGI